VNPFALRPPCTCYGDSGKGGGPVRTLALALLLAALAHLAVAQQPANIPRVGLLSNDAHTTRNATLFWTAFRDELRRAGWEEGRTVAYELASPDGDYARLPEVARELVARRVDLIAVPGNLASKAVKEATRTIPVVFIGVGDPLGAGLVTSLARPGGNLTGVANMSNELIAKRLEILLEVAKGARRVAYLTYETTAAQFDVDAARAAAELGLDWQPVKVTQPGELAAAVASRGDADASFVSDAVLVFPRETVVSLVSAHGKPAIYPNSTFVVRAGGLMSYAANNLAVARRAAQLTDRILRGAKPDEIPVEQPTSFELAVNLGAARSQGIVIPPSLMLRADEVIE